jgi:hypothetical protein
MVLLNIRIHRSRILWKPLQLRPWSGLLLWAAPASVGRGALGWLRLLDQNVEEVLVVRLEEHGLVQGTLSCGGLLRVLHHRVAISSQILLALCVRHVEQDSVQLVVLVVGFDLGASSLARLLTPLTY